MESIMLKKISVAGILYLVVAALFALGAISKTISNDSIVITMQWFCAVIFAGVGVWQFRKKAS